MFCRIVTHLIILATVLSQFGDLEGSRTYLIPVSAPRMHHGVVFCVIALSAMLYQSAGELIIAPQRTESKVGDTTYFNCSTDLAFREIFWHHGLRYIYTGDTMGILELYRGRFEIDRNASNASHNLVIHSVEPGDAGEYICIDDDGIGTRRSAELVVLDNEPDCQSNIQPDGVIGQNIFKIPPDEVQLSCIVTYHGNIPPQMEWKKVGENKSIKDNITSSMSSSNRIIYSLKLKGGIALNNSSYVCQTTKSIQNQYNCTSETIKVLHFVGGNMIEQKVFRGDEITCTANSNTFPCINQWHHDNNTFDETITTHLLGEYLCLVKCRIRGTDYTFHAKKAFVVEATTSPSGITAAVVVVIVSIIATVFIALLLIGYKKNKSAQRIEREQRNMQLEQEQGAQRIEREQRNMQLEQEQEHEVAEGEIELLHKIKKEGTSKETAIQGVAILGGKLFLVRKKSSILQVYDFKNFNLPVKSLNVEDVVGAIDICSCKNNNCLYIMDMKITKEILTIDAAGKVLRKWSTKDDGYGFLSVTAEGNVIITVQNKHMLLEYSSDGKWVRDLNLPENIHPLHAIKLDNNRYIVSHGTNDPLNRVCIVDSDGHVEKSFGHEVGSTENQLHIPRYLAVGSRGSVWVVDRCNNRVLLLDSNLELKAKVVPKYNQIFRSPQKICLDETLFVVVVTEKDQTTSSKKQRKLIELEEKIKDADPLQYIEEECSVLVFKIQPLLQKYDV